MNPKLNRRDAGEERHAAQAEISELKQRLSETFLRLAAVEQRAELDRCSLTSSEALTADIWSNNLVLRLRDQPHPVDPRPRPRDQR